MLVEEHARNGPVMFVTPKRSVLLRKLTQLGSLSNHDGDGNENGKKQWALIGKTKLSVVARLQSESASFHVLSRTGTQNNFTIQLQKHCQHLTN